MPTDEMQLHLMIDGSDVDAERLDTLTRRLMGDLRDLGAESVERCAGGAIPEGAKAADPFTLGALALAATPSFLPKLVEFLQAWTLRGNRAVKIKTPAGVEVEFTPETRLSQEELLALVERLSETQAT